MEAAGSKPKVLLLGEIDHAHEAWSQLSQTCTILTPKSLHRPDFLAELRSGSLDGCLVAYRTFASFSITGQIDTEVVSAFPSSLKFICHVGAGYDQIGIKACTDRGIKVSNTPTAVDDSTADIGIWLLLGALRNLSVSMFNLRRGDWRSDPQGRVPSLGHDPEGKILGIIGMGGIGRNFAKKCGVFGIKVKYYNRTRLSEDMERECGAEYWEMERVLRESDVISLNLPLNAHTRHTISTPQFALMKKGVIIINTARGAVIDEAALVKALDDGIVSSVGLDVYEDEPQIHEGLIKNEKCSLVPHMGTWTVETQTKMEEWAIDNVSMAVREARLKSIVPEQRDMQ